MGRKKHFHQAVLSTQALPGEPRLDPEVPGVSPAPGTSLRRFRVSLKDVAVLTHDDRGRPQRSDHLDVDAADEQEAVEKFALHNGIPWVSDPLTSRRQLASVHTPVVQDLVDIWRQIEATTNAQQPGTPGNDQGQRPGRSGRRREEPAAGLLD
jgi:hypothetical protein